MALQPDGCVILLIEALGYTGLDAELHAFTGDYFQILMEGSNLISEASMALRMQTMSADEKEKMEMIKKNQEMFKAKQKADAEYKAQLEHISQRERKVKQAEKNETSKANKLKYGANIVKFEPPAEQRKG